MPIFFKNLIAALAVLFISACAVHFTPSYNSKLEDSLYQAHSKAISIFDKAKSRRGNIAEATYESAISDFASLKIAYEARPTSGYGALLSKKISSSLNIDCGEVDCTNPTPKFLSDIILILENMRSQDRKGDLPLDQVILSQIAYEAHIKNALTFESSLGDK